MIKTTGFSTAFSLAIILASLAFSGVAGADEVKSVSTAPAQFVQKLSNTALMSLTAKGVSRATRETRVREILQNNFDIAAIGRFAMGTYWKEASEAQHKEYMTLFEDMIVQTYTTRFENYSGQTLKVSGSIVSGDRDFVVASQIIQKDGPPINLEWRVRQKDGSLRIVDVVVEGVSMSVTQRSDFAAVIQHGGSKIEALLSSLRERKKGVHLKKPDISGN